MNFDIVAKFLTSFFMESFNIFFMESCFGPLVEKKTEEFQGKHIMDYDGIILSKSDVRHLPFVICL